MHGHIHVGSCPLTIPAGKTIFGPCHDLAFAASSALKRQTIQKLFDIANPETMSIHTRNDHLSFECLSSKSQKNRMDRKKCHFEMLQATRKCEALRKQFEPAEEVLKTIWLNQVAHENLI